jgi:hypothetical protein
MYTSLFIKKILKLKKKIGEKPCLAKLQRPGLKAGTWCLEPSTPLLLTCRKTGHLSYQMVARVLVDNRGMRRPVSLGCWEEQ